MTACPYAPIPSDELPDTIVRPLIIRPVSVSFVSRHGARDYFESDRSNVMFARLHAAARSGETITHFSQDGLDLDADSLAALNCYLRTGRAMGRMKLPFDRLPISGTHRYAWASFCEHLRLQFR